MPHDDTWQFYRVGIFFERAVGALAVLKVAMPRVVEAYHEVDEESADLTALLRLLGCLDAYRREFRSRAYVDRICSLMLQAKHVPSSVNFCLRNLDYAIGTLSYNEARALGSDLSDQIHGLLQVLADFPLAQSPMDEVGWLDAGELPPKSAQHSAEFVGEAFAGLAEQVEALHERLEDIFFSHQDVFAREPTLFGLE